MQKAINWVCFCGLFVKSEEGGGNYCCVKLILTNEALRSEAQNPFYMPTNSNKLYRCFALHNKKKRTLHNNSMCNRYRQIP